MSIARLLIGFCLGLIVGYSVCYGGYGVEHVDRFVWRSKPPVEAGVTVAVPTTGEATLLANATTVVATPATTAPPRPSQVDERACDFRLPGRVPKEYIGGCAKTKGLSSPSLPAAEYLASKDFFDESFRSYRFLTGRSPPAGYDAWLKYARENKCVTSFANYSQIDRDLQPFRHRSRPNEPTLTLAAIRDGAARTGRSQQKNIHSLRAHAAWREVAPLLSDRLLFVSNGWDEPVVLPGQGDGPYGSPAAAYDRCPCLQHRYPRDRLPASHHGFFHCPDTFPSVPKPVFPIFSHAKISCYLDIVMPTHYHLETPRFEDQNTWSTKRNAVFWRGSSTGGRPRTEADFKYFPRLNLVKWATQQSKNASLGYEVDVGLTAEIQCGSFCGRYASYGFPVRARVPMRDQLQNKYIVIVEGNTFVSRLASQLQSKSLILFQEPVFVEWHTDRIRPWEHYVPFKLDFSDLSARMDWVKTHDEEARQIAARAEQQILQNVRIADMKCYFSLLMLEYQSLIVA